MSFVIVLLEVFIFFEDGSFSQQKSSGGSAPGVTTSSTSQIDGTYEINGYTITFKNTSGQVEKKLFYYFPEKITDNPQKTTKTIGIGSSYFSLKN